LTVLLASVGAGVGGSGCHDAGASPVADVESAPPAKSVALRRPSFPLRVSANRRFLVDSRHRPFLMVGDSPQALIAKLSVDEATRYIANRAAAGFNTIWVNLLCNDYTGGAPSGRTADGLPPFKQEGQLSTPNEAYFARADAIIRAAARHGVAVLLDPIETGGWLNVLRATGTRGAYAFGRYIGSRYRSFPNIVWMSGNDFQTWRDPADDALALAVARGIRNTDPGHLQTVELDFHGLTSSSSDDARWRNLISLDAAYSFRPTYAQIATSYRRTRHLPVFLVEASYEGEHDYLGPSTLRRQEYWTLLSGATGQLYGNRYTWQFIDGWETHLDTVGSRQMTYVANLFAPLRWYDLVPDFDHRLVVSGHGKARTAGTVENSDYVTAARTSDGELAIAYLPAGQTIRVNMGALAGRIRARWYDPSSGSYRRAAGLLLPSAGTRRFAPPGENGDGDSDWVLVLRRADRTKFVP
jgi:uncharacterized protein DUF4038/collagenase-like protein with putative collagen-binding domain